jgi:two-component system sensor histidine kinase BaeS
VLIVLLLVLITWLWAGGIWLAAYGFVVVAVMVLLFAAMGARIIGLFRRATRPVDDLIEAAGRVQAGDYTTRVTESGPAELRSLARAFNQMSERLEDTDSRRRTFMADVSHELRTPLAVIQGQLEAVRDGIYPADPEHLAPALEQVAALERLVDDLRTLALTETGSLHLVREHVDMGALVADVVAGFRPSAEAGRLSLDLVVERSVPRVYVDPARIGSVVRNLLANAIRYTPPGGSVTVGVREADGQVEVDVADAGRGIDPGLLPTVFERFSRSTDSSGSGLGLAIARTLVAAHGGSIHAASEPGQGTTVTFRVPAATG